MTGANIYILKQYGKFQNQIKICAMMHVLYKVLECVCGENIHIRTLNHGIICII